MHVADLKMNHAGEAWYIDIYSTDMDKSRTVVDHNITVEIYPWRLKTLEAVQLMNSKVRSVLQEKPKDTYYAKRHKLDNGPCWRINVRPMAKSSAKFCDFLRKRTSEEIIEKRFHPINFNLF